MRIFVAMRSVMTHVVFYLRLSAERKLRIEFLRTVGVWHTRVFFYIRGSVHRNSRLKKSNKMHQYVDVYLLQNYSTRFGRPSLPSSGVHKTVVAASDTDHTIWRSPISPYLVTFEAACSPGSMICTRGCNYSFMYSWWWGRWTPETCRVILQ